jgi:FkbM family methyltransferase
MGIKYLGSEYGGWSVDLDLLKNGDTIIDAGLGEDVSFLTELNQHVSVNIVGVDPTKKSHDYLELNPVHNMELLKMAIGKAGQEEIRIFKNSNPNHVSESCYEDHQSTIGMESYSIKCISFKELIEKYSPSLIKMDIEGAEYDVLYECIGVKQICVEFHHHCIPSKTKSDTEECINFMIHHGYSVVAIHNEREYTLVLNK